MRIDRFKLAAILIIVVLAGLAFTGIWEAVEVSKKATFHFEIMFPDSLESEVLDGRILLLISNDDSEEPRFQIEYGPQTQIVFGQDVEGLAPGHPFVLDDRARGYPVTNLEDIPAGDYQIQALLHRYETFHRADAAFVKVPMDRGEGQKWNEAPGNLYSTPRRATLDPEVGATIRIRLDRRIPLIPEPYDTRWIKHIKIKSKRLSKFWGRPIHLGAHILLPKGFDDHPNARYPLVINHGHFPHDFTGFRPEPPDPNLEPDYSERFRVHGYNRIQQEYAHKFYKAWTGRFPRVLLIKIQHANPYYDDSYAVNSANLGPYGDAITYELIPYIEEKFRGIGAGWARFLYGGSTGGWEALAAQVFYPDEYNGCWAACPDPIDFRAYGIVNIYEDENAYFLDSAFKRTPRPAKRNHLGEIVATLEEANRYELALGSHSRSGEQWDIWEAVYSPKALDGYPQRIWDKESGEIDPKVAAHWRENYDLRHILERDWATLGPKLQGKIHIYCGDMDNYYLNNAVKLMQDFLEKTTEPHYDGEVDFGDGDEHCWNGDHERPNHISRLRYHQMFIPRIVERIEASAPDSADVSSWRY